jgi:hypothetical protein
VIEIGGKKIIVRPLKARVLLDLEEKYEKPRELTRHIMAACAVLEDGSPAFAPEQIEELETPDYRRLQNAVWKAHNPPDAKKD